MLEPIEARFIDQRGPASCLQGSAQVRNYSTWYRNNDEQLLGCAIEGAMHQNASVEVVNRCWRHVFASTLKNNDPIHFLSVLNNRRPWILVADGRVGTSLSILTSVGKIAFIDHYKQYKYIIQHGTRMQ